MLRRSATILFIALLALGGAACSDDGDSGLGVGQGSGSGENAFGSDETPSAEFCDLLLNGDPRSSVISENIQYYEELKALAPDSLKDDLDAIVGVYQTHAGAGEDSVTISADPEAQPHLTELVGVAFNCPTE